MMQSTPRSFNEGAIDVTDDLQMLRDICEARRERLRQAISDLGQVAQLLTSTVYEQQARIRNWMDLPPPCRERQIAGVIPPLGPN
jgi:hypothetical protein